MEWRGGGPAFAIAFAAIMAVAPRAEAKTCIESCGDRLCRTAPTLAVASIVSEPPGEQEYLARYRIDRVVGADAGPDWQVGAELDFGSGPPGTTGAIFYVAYSSLREQLYYGTVLWTVGDRLNMAGCEGDPAIEIESAIEIAQARDCPARARRAGLLVDPCGTNQDEPKSSSSSTGCGAAAGNATGLVAVALALLFDAPMRRRLRR